MNVLVMASTPPSMAQPMMEDTDSATGKIRFPYLIHITTENLIKNAVMGYKIQVSSNRAR